MKRSKLSNFFILYSFLFACCFLVASSVYASTRYFSGLTDSDWNTTANWFADAGFSTPSFGPIDGDTVYVESTVSTGPSSSISLTDLFVAQTANADLETASNITVSNLSTFGKTGLYSSSLTGYIYTNAAFYNFSANAGTIIGDVIFNDSSANGYHGDGYIYGNAIFNDTTRNDAALTGDATFACGASNFGSVGGTTTNLPCTITISAIASSTTANTATITWTTDLAASSTVNFGSSTSYGFSSTTNSLVTDHSIILSGLSTSTIYHFQVASGNDPNGVATSSDFTFMTKGLPVVTTSAAANISPVKAQFNGNISNTGGLSVTGGFIFGTSTAYGATTTATVSGMGSFSSSTTSLLPSTTYHFKAYATNSLGTSYGADQQFTTWKDSFIVNGHTLVWQFNYGGSYYDSGFLIQQYQPLDVGPGSITPYDHNIWFIETDSASIIHVQFIRGDVVNGFTDCLSKQFSHYPNGDPAQVSDVNNIMTLEGGYTINGDLAGAHVSGVFDPSNYPVANQSCLVSPNSNTQSSGGGGGGSSGGGIRIITNPSLPVASSTTATTTNSFLYIFTSNLTLTSKGNEVLRLQRFLNSINFSVSLFGPGSVGNETSFFGPKTKNALARFQASVGIKPSVGFFGPITKKYINTHFFVGK